MSYGGHITEPHRVIGGYPVAFSKAKSLPTYPFSRSRASS